MGSYVGLRVSKQTFENLKSYIEEHKLLRMVSSENRFHVTVISSQIDLPKVARGPIDPITVDTYWFRVLKTNALTNALVLTFQSPEINKRHHELKEKYEVETEFDNFLGHLTLTYNFRGNIKELIKPTFPIILDEEYQEPMRKMYGT